MYNEKMKLPAKGAVAVITALLCCVMALGTVVFAVSAQQIVELNADGSEARLVMSFPQAAAEKIASMQISLDISTSADGADIEFIPDGGLPAKIVESRYHSDTGVLTIYLAGTSALFSGDSPLTVGKLRLGGSDVSATVSVKEGSIKFVRGSELVTPDGDIVYPGSVTISTGGSITPLPPDAPSSSSSSSSSVPSSSTSSTSLPSPADSSDTPPDVPVIVPVEPADTSSLADAVDRANGYKRGDYTADSFGTLTEALDKAKAVLSNTGATQDEVDEALLILENAIGMLAAANTAPSGTDGYGSSGDTSLPSQSGADSSESQGSESSSEKPTGSGSSNSSDASDGSGQTVGSGREPSDSGQTPDTSKTESSGEEKPGNSAVMWIIIVMAVLAVTAAALIVALKLTKKK